MIGGGCIRLMLIMWVGNVAYRASVLKDVKDLDWIKTKPV